MKKKQKLDKIKVLYFAVVSTTLIYIIWRAFFTIPFKLGWLSCTFGILLFLSETLGAIESIQHCYGMGEQLIPELPHIENLQYPDIDVFIATYNEPCDLLYKTVNGCLHMDYPNQQKVHIYLLDDGNREEVGELAQQMGVGYIIREEHLHAKAGNLNNALQYTNSPYIVTFDADMIPLSDFLIKTVPYFFLPYYQKMSDGWIKREQQDDMKIGFIQTPQCFYNPDLFQYNLFLEQTVPNEQDYFYRDVQLARNKTNSAIYGGSNTVISRAALQEIGGFFTGVITEDFATGIAIQSCGYTCYAIEDVLAVGLSPTDLKSLIKQRERWARGCIQTLRKVNILTRKGLSLGQKISYLSSLLYWYTPMRRLMYILSPILFAVFQIQVVRCSFVDLLLWWLPQYLVYQYAIKQFSHNIRTNRLSNIYDTILFPSLIVAVFLETFGISQKNFSVTKKERVSNEITYQIKHAIVHVVLFVLSIVALSYCIKEIFFGVGSAYIIVFFWTIVNMYSLLMAIFFMTGRQYYRNHERFYITIPIQVEGIDKPCSTEDLSDTGLSFVCDFPYYLSPDKSISLIFNGMRLTGQVKYVSYAQGKWKYGIRFIHLTRELQKDYFHFLYNRKPTLPSKVPKNHSFFDELSLNILKRSHKGLTYNRKIARLELHKTFITTNSFKVICQNFNYEYMLLKGDSLEEYFEIPLQEQIVMYCIRVKVFQDTALYQIKNIDELVTNQKFLKLVGEWSQEHIKNIQNLKDAEKEEKEFDERLYY